MKCCANCFKDTEISAIIEGIASKGDCDICKKKNFHIYDTAIHDDLVAQFEDFLDIYTPVANLPNDYPKANLDLLKNVLWNKWNIFNTSILTAENIYNLIVDICHEKYAKHPDLFDKPVGILELHQGNYLNSQSILKVHQWEDFVCDIKNKNRFHTDHINRNILEIFLKKSQKTYKKGYIFYRARVCTDELGFDLSHMGVPPAKDIRAGRANSEGISCLYLADDIKTTLHEVRAGIYDFITVGKFEIKGDIKIVDLTSINQISPFGGLDPTTIAINMDHLKKISTDIAKPLRRYDSTLDYLPTQYISDFIRSLGYDGIEYKSTMCPNGYNLVLFEGRSAECIAVDNYDVKSINYDYDKVT